MVSGEPRISRWVCLWEMRFQFNSMGFDDRVAAGELIVEEVRDDPAPPGSHQARGMRSQTIHYVTTAEREPLAECHRYIHGRGKKKGQLGGSGQPDPKWLLVGEEEWNVEHTEDGGPCPECATWRPRAAQARAGAQ